jgi:senataxin
MAMPPALYKFITHPRHFNKSQKEALLAALKQRGVTLVQGPPGTGKTATILGLLSVLLHARPRGTAATPEALGLRAADMLAEASAEEARAGRPETAAEPTARAAARIALARAAMPWLRPPPPPSAHDVAAAARAAAAAVLLVEAGAQPLGALEQKPYYPSVTDTDEHVPLGSLEPRADGKGGGAARVGGGKGASGPARVLVCTPSNAAVDEIVRRLLTFGIRDADGEPYFPDVVRVGPNFAEDVRARSLDVLARKKAAELEQDSSAAGGARGPGAGSNFRLLDRARLAVLNSSSIVCTTLSCAGYAMFAQLQRGFDTVLIDEAAQVGALPRRRLCRPALRLDTRARSQPAPVSRSFPPPCPPSPPLPSPPIPSARRLPPSLPSQAVEVASLIPLRAGCERLIMVGDPAQLPATIFSAHAANAGYERSLFERLQQAGHRTHLLRTQYRMHPEISRWPAKVARARADGNGDSAPARCMRRPIRPPDSTARAQRR